MTSGLRCSSKGIGLHAPSNATPRLKSTAQNPPRSGRFTDDDIAPDTTPTHSSLRHSKRESISISTPHSRLLHRMPDISREENILNIGVATFLDTATFL